MASGTSSFPESLDNYTERPEESEIRSQDINDLQAAVENIEAEAGARDTSNTWTLHYRLRNTSSVDPGHLHSTSGISGQIAIAQGGTGASTESGARSNLGLAIGSDVQAWGAVLDDLNTLGAPASDGQFIVATGAGAFAYESGATARTSIGLGTSNAVSFAGVTSTGALVVNYAGPNSIGASGLEGQIGLQIQGSFTSSGISSLAEGVRFRQTVTGASGDTTWILGTRMITDFVTQTATESIGEISQLYIGPGSITNNLTGGGVVTMATTLHVAGAPSAGATNYAVLVDSGTTRLGGILQATFTNASTGTGLIVGVNDGSTQEVKRDSSTRRIKENITSISYDDASKLLDIEPVSYSMIDGGARDAGFIAEDFEKAGLTDILTYDGEGRVAGFKNFGRGISAYLLKVIQDQQKRIELLEAS